MSTRQFKISTVGALSLSLAAGCEDSADDSPDAEPVGDSIVGIWSLPGVDVYNTDTYLSDTETSGECFESYQYSYTMTVEDSSTVVYSGWFEWRWEFRSSCDPMRRFPLESTQGLSAVRMAEREYVLMAESGISLTCLLDADTLACVSEDGSDIIFER